MSEPVSIVVPSYNTLEFTRIMLNGLYKNTLEPFEVIVVDDGSQDGTLEYLRRFGKDKNNFRYIVSGKNTGFAMTCNLGFKQSKYDKVILLNTDTKVTSGWVEALLKTMASPEKIGVVGCKLIGYVNHDQIVHGGTYSNYKDGGHLVGNVEKGDHEISKEMKWVTFACVLINKECWKDVGGIPPIKIHGNDSIFCAVARSKGWKVWYCADCVVHHYEGKSISGFKSENLDLFEKIREEDGVIFREMYEKYGKYLRD